MKGLGLKRVIFIVSAIILIVISYTVGTSNATVDLDGQALKATALADEIGSLESELETINASIEEKEAEVEDISSEIGGLENEHKKLTSEIEEQQELVEKLDDFESIEKELKNNINKLEGELKEKENTVSSLDADIENKQGELDAIGEAITLKEDEPVSLPAGQFVVGYDIDPNRYTAKEGSSNFVVYSSSGSLKVNTILGGGTIGVDEYVFFAEEGDVIELEAPAKFYVTE